MKTLHDIISDKRKYLISLVITIVLMVIFSRSFYWAEPGYSIFKVIEACIITISLLVLPVIIMKCNFLFVCANQFFQIIKANRKRVFFSLFLSVLSIPAAFGGAWLSSLLFFGGTYNRLVFWVCLAVLILTITLVLYYRPLSQRAEYLFITIALILGTMYIQISPAATGFSWDDEIHYQRTISISNVFNNIMYESDYDNIVSYLNRVRSPYFLDREVQDDYREYLNEQYREQKILNYSPHNFGIYSIAYIVPAMGIILGRGLGLSYAGVFNMGRWFGLLQYIMIMTMAIRQLKSGKRLASVLGLIPTLLFMACSYSYDPFIIAFCLLGYSIVIGILQDPSRRLTKKDIWLSTGSLLIGCLPKAIYFPLLFPLLFIPKSKYEEPQQKKHHILLVILAGLLLVGSFLIPMLIPGSGALSGDSRGGPDVNAGGQIAFILANPFTYLKTLLLFLTDYLSPLGSWEYLGTFAYLGSCYLWGPMMLALFASAVFDQRVLPSTDKSFRLSSLIGILGCLILIPTSMYISFTGVGYDTIAGCQYRYLLPLLFPFLYLFIPRQKRFFNLNQSFLTYLPPLIMAGTFIYNSWKYLVFMY